MRLEGLHAGYGGGDVLKGVTLAVRRGEMTGLIGPNGAGKTTLFRVATGALAPTAGRVFLAGRLLATLSPRDAARRMAFAPQMLEVPFSHSVREFVGLGRLPHLGRFAAPGPRDHEAVARAMALVDLLDFAQRPLHTLSGGERQRAVVAQALAQEPEVLLLDEPAAFLDINHQVEVFELLHRIRQRGPAVVVVLHDLNLAAEYAERVVLLRDGRVEADGAPREVITSERIARAFGVSLDITLDPLTARPAVRYRRVHASSGGTQEVAVHVLCGGGTGSFLLRRLHLEGFQVTAGALNEGDSDLLAAESLGIPAVREEPFCPVGERAGGEARALMEKAAAIVVTGVPFGRGNVRNLEAIPPGGAGRTVVVRTAGPRDFTGGQADAQLKALAAGGARFVESDREALQVVLERWGRGTAPR